MSIHSISLIELSLVETVLFKYVAMYVCVYTYMYIETSGAVMLMLTNSQTEDKHTVKWNWLLLSV